MTPNTKACPACGETIKFAAVKCRYCNENIPEFLAAQDALKEKDVFTGNPSSLYSIDHWAIVLLTLGLAWFYFKIKSISTRYEITSQRIHIIKGIFSKTKQAIELYRVDDFEREYPFHMRIVGHGELHVKSSDRNTPDLTIKGLREIEPIYESLRKHVQNERERRGIKVWANA